MPVGGRPHILAFTFPGKISVLSKNFSETLDFYPIKWYNQKYKRGIFMSIIKKMTAVFLAVVMCIFLMPTADAAGSTLSCNTYNGTINVGKSGALLITATGNKTLSAGVSDSNVLSYKWDTKWTTDTSIKLIITGKKSRHIKGLHQKRQLGNDHRKYHR